MSQIIKTEEFEQDGNVYIREIYDSGTIAETLKSEVAYKEPINQ